MNILLITSSYPPEIRSSSHLMQEMAESLRDRGHGVFVVTSYPHHNLADGHNNRRFNIITDENGIQVLRIKTIPAHMVSYFIRGFSQSILPYIFFHKIKKLIKEKKLTKKIDEEGHESIVSFNLFARVGQVDGGNYTDEHFHIIPKPSNYG